MTKAPPVELAAVPLSPVPIDDPNLLLVLRPPPQLSEADRANLPRQLIEDLMLALSLPARFVRIDRIRQVAGGDLEVFLRIVPHKDYSNQKVPAHELKKLLNDVQSQLMDPDSRLRQGTRSCHIFKAGLLGEVAEPQPAARAAPAPVMAAPPVSTPVADSETPVSANAPAPGARTTRLGKTRLGAK
eukprot:TRINITY_DN3052_c0_g1_i10.p2 TRINITY_DN3052_c0_g1~~TRINITY_DN3052_c0_g1_i10.p2  ORF type:complete len:186 (-),score=57.16 TRINITY_DN3052_c0_g1_i10:323-880(-)